MPREVTAGKARFEKRNRECYTIIYTFGMRRTIPALLLAASLAASSSAPVCELVCTFMHEATVPAEGLASAGVAHCHEDSSEAGESSRPHPCRNGVQHRTELSASVVLPARALDSPATVFIALPAAPLAEPGILRSGARASTQIADLLLVLPPHVLSLRI